MRFRRVALGAPSERIAELAAFYGSDLGLAASRPEPDHVEVTVGESALAFASKAGRPFHHFAILVPGDRFRAALDWARARTPLLTVKSGDVVLDFDFWDAQACYFLDPAGNIVELIAHRGIEETAATDPFDPSELVGISELGLVGDRASIARELEDAFDLELWSGSSDTPGGLAFVGDRARTFVISPPGRGWLPTGRPAEPHPVEVVLECGRAGVVRLDEGSYLRSSLSMRREETQSPTSPIASR